MKLIEIGREPHPAYYQRPEILPWHSFYWEAFHELSTERQIGMGIGPIPRSHIIAYAVEQDLFGDAAEHFTDIIRRLDVEYLKSSDSSSKDQPDTSVSPNDVVGMGQVLERLRARAAGATKRHVKSKGNDG